MSSHAMTNPAHRRTNVTLPHRDSGSRRTRILQIVVLLALIPVLLFYLLPRVVNLVATPYRLDHAAAYGHKYNPRLFAVAKEEENVTLPAFTALDQMNAAVKRVRGVDAQSAQQLTVLIGQIHNDLQPILDSAVVNVHGLVGSLNSLGAQLNAINPQAVGAASAVAANRATLGAILANARATAAQVHKAREEADSSAHSVSGK